MSITIFPTSFEFSLLHCFQENGKNVCVLFTGNKTAQYVHLELDNDIFQEKYIVRCEILQTKNKSKQILSLIECLNPKEANLTKFLENHPSNEMQIIIPPRFSIEQIEFVSNFIIPNFCGDVCGIFIDSPEYQAQRFGEFIEEQRLSPNGNTPISMIVRKTKLPEIYEVLSLSTANRKGILFVRTLDEAKKLNLLFDNCSLITLQCSYDKIRNHWIPLFSKDTL